MRVAGIVKDSIVDGIGVRDTIFLQGCHHHCEGCHNPQTWAIYGGSDMSVSALADEMANSSNNITISGGEPLLQYSELLEFMELVNATQNKRFWLYTGFTYGEIKHSMWKELAKYVDVVIDGEFDKNCADKNLLFRGSSNQRLIDLNKSLEQYEVVLWEDANELA